MVDFSSAITDRRVCDGFLIHQGTYTNGATGDKNIDTGLRVVRNIKLTQKGSAVIADVPSINETLPCDGSAVTIVTTGDTDDGYWRAEGE